MSGSFNVSNDTPVVSQAQTQNINSSGLARSFTISDSSSNFNIQNYNSSIITEEYDVFADTDSEEAGPSTTDINPTESGTIGTQEPTPSTENDTTTINGENPETPTSQEEVPSNESSEETINTPSDYTNTPNEEGVMANESVNSQSNSTIGGGNPTTTAANAAAPIGAAGVVGASAMGNTSDTPKPPSPSDIAKPKMPGDSKPDDKKDDKNGKPSINPETLSDEEATEDTLPDELVQPKADGEIIETGTEYEQINEEAESLYDMEEPKE